MSKAEMQGSYALTRKQLESLIIAANQGIASLGDMKPSRPKYSEARAKEALSKLRCVNALYFDGGI